MLCCAVQCHPLCHDMPCLTCCANTVLVLEAQRELMNRVLKNMSTLTLLYSSSISKLQQTPCQGIQNIRQGEGQGPEGGGGPHRATLLTQLQCRSSVTCFRMKAQECSCILSADAFQVQVQLP